MAVHKIKNGLNLPIKGQPEQRIDAVKTAGRVALLGADYVGMRPTMHVQVGDEVQRGQLLFEDKKTPGVRFTSIASGRVVSINRGERRVFESLVLELTDDERSNKASTVRFAADTGKHPAELSSDQVKELLLESGLWTSLRTRPFSKVADPLTRPRSIFVTATDTNPLAPDVGLVLAGREDDFERGLVAVSKLTDGQVFVCTHPELALQMPEVGRIQREDFAGPHPAGTVGFHIHTLDPVDRNKLVWHLNYQDVLAIGRLFADGQLDVSRVISLAGPVVERPRLLRSRLGASIDELVAGELQPGENRSISGSVLSGRKAMGETTGFLGRYHLQVSALAEGREREFLGWLRPGSDRFSVVSTYISSLMPKKKYDMTTSTQGSDRSMVPIGMYEKVFPYEILPTFLLRSLLVTDVERAEQLGALELDEEDVALCSFVCPGKHDYGPHLRDVLTIIEREG